MKIKNSHLKYVTIALVIVFLIATAFFFLEAWENRDGKFPVSSLQEGIVEFNGKEYVKKDNIETFLVLGVDKYKGADTAESHQSGVQADFLMLFVFDNDRKQCQAIQINRDTMTQVNKLAVGGATIAETFTKQIALAYNYANADNDKIKCRNTKDSVEYLFEGVTVDHYLSFTMDAVSISCDLVGGVEVTALNDFTAVDENIIKGEKINLNGEQALLYVRTRYGLEDSTNAARMLRQQQYIKALYEKMNYCMKANDEFLIKFIDTLDDFVVYDLPDQKLLKIAEEFTDYEFLGIREVKGESKLGDEYVEFYPDEESVKQITIDLFYMPKTDDN